MMIYSQVEKCLKNIIVNEGYYVIINDIKKRIQTLEQQKFSLIMPNENNMNKNETYFKAFKRLNNNINPYNLTNKEDWDYFMKCLDVVLRKDFPKNFNPYIRDFAKDITSKCKMSFDSKLELMQHHIIID